MTKPRQRNKKVHLCGSDDVGVSVSKSLGAHAVRLFRAMEEGEKLKRHLARDSNMRDVLERLCENPSATQEEDRWEDDTMVTELNVADVLAGNIPIDLSHEGGEFYSAVHDELCQSTK
jgi:hypothetical protein